MTIVLLTAVGFYVLVCAAMWALQDKLVFPGAGRGDRGVPALVPPAVVGFVGAGAARARIATVAAQGGAAKPCGVAVYFGGNGEDLYAAVYSAAELAEHGLEAIAVEHPGFGASAGRPSVASLLANALVAVGHARTRAQELGVPLVVVGSSLGSFCAVHAAAAGGVAKLVLRAPPTRLADAAGRAYPWLPVRLLLAHRFDNLEPAAKVVCPVLVLHGDDDVIVPQAFGRELAAAMPHATFVPIPGRGHNDLELAPAGVAGAALRAFLAK
ncbi:MAG: alpha/beta hydrolase [Planctomycetes bacterium]|nr:alpha/beta hydrolase [Planctomycetota bacterium]